MCTQFKTIDELCYELKWGEKPTMALRQAHKKLNSNPSTKNAHCGTDIANRKSILQEACKHSYGWKLILCEQCMQCMFPFHAVLKTWIDTCTTTNTVLANISHHCYDPHLRWDVLIMLVGLKHPFPSTYKHINNLLKSWNILCRKH